MTAHSEIRPAPQPGAAAVGDLRSLEGMQALAILMLRDWCADEAGRLRAASVLHDALGPEAGAAAERDWAAFVAELNAHARRPLMRHGARCLCVGADEAVVAQLLAQAAEGEREEAMLVLSLLVRADRLTIVHHYAERAGLVLRRVAGCLARGTEGGSATLH